MNANGTQPGLSWWVKLMAFCTVAIAASALLAPIRKPGFMVAALAAAAAAVVAYRKGGRLNMRAKGAAGVAAVCLLIGLF